MKRREYSAIREITGLDGNRSSEPRFYSSAGNGKLLLIDKKRGLGAGKINGPGGRLEPGETPRQAAIRELREELCVTPTGVRRAGELLFQFTNGHSIHGYVFTATGIRGKPRKPCEAKLQSGFP